MNITQGGLAADDRGFLRFVNEVDFSQVKRFYQVNNHEQGFIRAWHGHKYESKYCFITKGTILLATVQMLGKTAANAIDEIRIVNELKTLTTQVLSDAQPKLAYIPPGMYNGFKTLTPDASVLFFSTSTLEESKNDDFRLPYDYYGKEIWEVIPR